MMRFILFAALAYLLARIFMYVLRKFSNPPQQKRPKSGYGVGKTDTPTAPPVQFKDVKDAEFKDITDKENVPK
ncbi:MAG: hypothetical protein KIT50_15780 [Bacteroidetes bacterium]|nr:hypothetical protein [Bacteroidota bacterium]